MNIQKTNITDKQIAFFREFLAGDTKRYIFGHNQYSKSIINELLKKNLTIEAIVDDFTTKTFDIFYMPDSTNPPNTLKEIKIPIIKTQGLKKGKVVVVVVVTSQTQTALQKLESLQNKQLEFMDYFAFYKVNYEFRKNENLIENLKESEKFGLDLLDLEFFDGFIASINNTKISTWKDFRAHFWDNKNAYENIYNLLNDAESKRQFEKIVNFRLNSDFRFMEGFSFRPKEQYFEDFLPLKNIDIFFDIGAYKGESSLEFIKHNKNYKQIYFFEPERKNFNEARENLKDFKHIKGFNIGLGDKKERLVVNSISTSSHLQKVDSPHSMDFMDFMESADSMDSAQKHYIEVNSLDNLIASGEIILNENILNGGGQQVMLKIDIESSEEFALKGASKLIRDYKPIIAICIYHRFDDFINLPNIIFSIYEDYKLYFRHYSSGLTESVMFFVPKSEV